MKEYRVRVYINRDIPGTVEALGCWLRLEPEHWPWSDAVVFEEYHPHATDAILSALRKTRAAGVQWVAIRTHHCERVNP
jgi:hypothetical protein